MPSFYNNISYFILLVMIFFKTVDFTYSYDFNLNTHSDSKVQEQTSDYILCRSCGADLANPQHIINHLSPQATVITNQTLFEKKGIDVQLLQNLVGIESHTITLSNSKCAPVHSWQQHFTWYPGYSWRPCICSQCRAYHGWLFEPIETASSSTKFPTKKGFFLLKIYNLLSENYFFTQSEEDFKGRYSENDGGYITLASPSNLPIIMPWYDNFKRSQYDHRNRYRHRDHRDTKEDEDWDGNKDEKRAKEQQDFLSLCEEDFKGRYSENDKEFMKVKLAPPSNPPVVMPWYDYSQRSQRRHGHRNRKRREDNRDTKKDKDSNKDKNKNLLKEQQDFLSLCEEDFKGRYSENDKEFMKVKIASPSNPPFFISWSDNSQRSHIAYNHSDRHRHGDNRDTEKDKDWYENQGKTLAEEQQDFLNQCEEDFKGRYSENDEKFMKVKLAPPSNPPIVVPWYDDSQRSQREHDHRDRYRHRDNKDTKKYKDSHNQCEEYFKGKYSDNDKEFMKIKRAPPYNPPIVMPWYDSSQRSQRSYGHGDRSHRDHRGRRGDKDLGRNRDKEENRYENRDKGRNRNSNKDWDKNRDRHWDKARDRGNYDYRYRPY